LELDAFVTSLETRGSEAPEWAIAAYEEAIGARLPDGYRAFLTQCNAGVARNIVCRYEARPILFYGESEPRTAREIDVCHVFGFREEEWLSLEHRNEMLRGQIPPSVIWIMDTFDACGTTCLGVKGPYAGKVYFWDRDGIYPEGDDDNIREFDLVADTFADFIAKLERRNISLETPF
jgi:hypothetical protein